jgi:hypothetical protein
MSRERKKVTVHHNFLMQFLQNRKKSHYERILSTDHFPSTLVSEVTGDRYGGDWPREQFCNSGIRHGVAELANIEACRRKRPELP